MRGISPTAQDAWVKRQPKMLNQGQVEVNSSLVAQLEAQQERIRQLEAMLAELSTGPQFAAQKLAIAVAKRHGVTFADLKSHSRERRYVIARHEAMWLVKKECPNWSLPMIGRLFQRDHTTVLFGIRAHAKRIKAA